MPRGQVFKRDRRPCMRRALFLAAAATRTSVLLFLSSSGTTTATAHEAATVEIDVSSGDIVTPLVDSVNADSITAKLQAPALDFSKENERKSDSSSSSIKINATTNHESYDVKHVPCGIWVALSSIPNAGLGVFAGRAFSSGEHMQVPGDITIPIVDFAAHNRHLDPFFFLWDDYTWSADALGMAHEGLDEVKGVSGGVGAIPNCFLPLVNVDDEDSAINEDWPGLHRSKDPGAGAFTVYGDRKTTAKRNIHAGEELFLDYGYDWFESRPELGPVPFHNDLDHATKLFRRWMHVKHFLVQEGAQGKKGSSWANTMALELWESFVVETAFQDSRTIGGFKHANFLTELQRLEETGMTLTQLRQEQATRSEEWLREHGSCADHMRPGPSKLPQAGKGAFAARFLPAGTAVGFLPMVHITDKNQLRMYSLTKPDLDKKKYYPILPGMSAQTSPTISGGWQLILNYCYGHQESTLLLCPYGPMVNYVNHNQTLANVALRWADPSRSGVHKPEFLQSPVHHLDSKVTPTLAMELVAMHDIAQGEEIFLDYGDAWERAWQQHVENWKPVDGADRYKSAHMLNQELIVHGKRRLKTDIEQRQDPYPSNVQLHCSETFINTLDEWEEAVQMGSTAEYLKRLPKHDYYCECKVIARTVSSNQTLYTAVAKVPKTVDDGYDEEENSVVEYFTQKLVDVPRQVFYFKDRPYTSNMFLENAFRHSIQIPDSIFPEEWKNV